jgi:cobalt-zinc-cadmium efflux system protein
MAHGHHDHHHHHEMNGDSTKNITLAFFLNTFFAVVELAGGYLTNSVAITSDALHDFGDSLSLGLSLYFQKKSARKSDEKYTYGYKRFSLVGAFVNSIVLIVGSVFVIREGVERMLSPVQPDTKGMMWLALLGIAVNGVAALRLSKGGLNERVISLHFIEDVLGWVAVLIGAIVMRFYDVPWLDPLLSLLIACYILFNVYNNIRSTIRIVLQGFPENIERKKLKELFAQYKEVESVHDLHVWSLDGNYHILSAHVVLVRDMNISDVEELKQKIKHDILHEGINHCTLEFELKNAHCVSCDEPTVS